MNTTTLQLRVAPGGLDVDGKQVQARFSRLRDPKRRSEEPEIDRPIKRPRPSSEPAQQAPGDVSTSADSETDSEDDSSDTTGMVKTSQKTFPCPFSLYNPQGRLCSHKDMNSPRSVEKHLFFRHRRPPFCPICCTTFHKYAECDAHIVSLTCKRTETLAVIEGLTETQTRDLSLCLDSRLPRAEQYRAMWEVVHEGVELPAQLRKTGSHAGTGNEQSTG